MGSVRYRAGYLPKSPISRERRDRPVDNFTQCMHTMAHMKIFLTHPVDDISAGRRLDLRLAPKISPASSASHTQGERRVCTCCPQTYAQMDSTLLPPG